MNSSFPTCREDQLQGKLLVRYGLRAMVFGRNIAAAVVRKLRASHVHLRCRFVFAEWPVLLSMDNAEAR